MDAIIGCRLPRLSHEPILGKPSMTAATPPSRGLSQRDRILLLGVTIVFVLIAVLSSARITLTLDESLHYHYGLFVPSLMHSKEIST
jgi:hypothetical protein